MADMANIDYQALKNIEHNFVRLDTLIPANDCLSEAIAQLPIFTIGTYNPKSICRCRWTKVSIPHGYLASPSLCQVFPLKKALWIYAAR